MKNNIDTIDSFIRLVLGISLIGVGVYKKTALAIFAGSFLAVEGIYKFCPIKHMLSKCGEHPLEDFCDNIENFCEDIKNINNI